MYEILSTISPYYDSSCILSIDTSDYNNNVEAILGGMAQNDIGYIDLQQYNDLQDDYNDLQDDYNELLEDSVPRSQYDNLLNDYNMLSNTINYGLWAYLTGYVWDSSISLEGYVQFTAIDINGDSQGSLNVPNKSTSHWSFDDLIEYNILQSGGILNMEALQNVQGYNSSYRYNIGALFNHLPLNSFYLYFTNMNNVQVRISDYSDNICNLYVNANEYVFISSSITDLVPFFEYEIYSINIINYNSNSDTTNGQINGSNNSLVAYNNGYSDAKNSLSYYENELSNLEKENAYLVDNINNLQQDYDNLNIQYKDIKHQFNEYLKGDNFVNLFFTIAETPFASFKQIWNVDFLGVNLAGFVTGILFIGLLIWVVKKIF